MNLNEINFSFAGKHCLRDFGCIYVESGGHAVSPKVTRNAYQIAGMSGTVLMDGEVYEPVIFGGSLFFDISPPSQAAAQQALRQIAAWLRQGRERLVFDYEPDRYYWAEVNSPAAWGYQDWIDGGLAIEFECQPFAYNRAENITRKSMTGTGADLVLMVDTDIPAPLCVDIENTGAAVITGATAIARGKRAVFSGMGLSQGQTLRVSMEPPAGASMDGMDAMPYCQRFDHITLPRGASDISVTLTYGTGATRGAAVTARARGRF